MSGTKPAGDGQGRRRPKKGNRTSIARVWHGLTSRVWRDEFVKYVSDTALQDLGKTKGNRGAFVLTRDIGDNTEYYLISFWDSMDSIRAFAGADINSARYYRRDFEMLAELEPKVMHFQVAAEVERPQGKARARTSR